MLLCGLNGTKFQTSVHSAEGPSLITLHQQRVPGYFFFKAGLRPTHCIR